jgi:hypothetical protein
MLILKKIGAVFLVVGIGGVLGPLIGMSLRGLKARESQLAGIALAGLGALIWIVGILVEKIEDSLQARRQTKMRQNARVPDDVIR